MIGVVLALHNTFGEPANIEWRAFSSVIGHIAGPDLKIDSPIARRLAAVKEAALTSSAGLRDGFAEVLGPTLFQAAQAQSWEARFRMIAAQIAAHQFCPFDDVRRGLEKLRELRIPCVALSSGWPAIEQRKADRAGFDGPIIFAHDVGDGVNVCSELVFERVTQTLLLPRELLWFVSGAAQTEIIPAQALGMRTIWVNRTGAPFPLGHLPPDYTIASFGELVDVLCEPYTTGLLALRHLLRTALEWRPGHFIDADIAGLPEPNDQ